MGELMSEPDGNNSGCSILPCPSPPQMKLYQIFIFATPFLFTLLLMLIFFILWIPLRRMSSQIRAPIFRRVFFSDPSIKQGLSKSFRQGLPMVLFDETLAASREDAQCTICLGDYQLYEKLQILPVCGHTFHVECIDEWFATNATCPICRTSLLGNGTLNLSVAQGAGVDELPRGANSWICEERVLEENPNENFNSRGDVCEEESSSEVAPSAEAAVRASSEHVITLERS